MHLPGGHDYLLAEPHAPADAIIVDVLLQMLKPAGGSRASVLDLGAGLGQYGHALLSADSHVAWRGYDGAGNVEESTGSFVRFVDLTVPLSLPRAAVWSEPSCWQRQSWPPPVRFALVFAHSDPVGSRAKPRPPGLRCAALEPSGLLLSTPVSPRLTTQVRTGCSRWRWASTCRRSMRRCSSATSTRSIVEVSSSRGLPSGRAATGTSAWSDALARSSPAADHRFTSPCRRFRATPRTRDGHPRLADANERLRWCCGACQSRRFHCL